MKALVLLVVGLLAGAFCTAALVNATGKRNAHERAVMVMLARHTDALRDTEGDAACTGPEARARLGQIAAAAREMDYAFADWDVPAFARQTRQFQSITTAAATSGVGDCPALQRTLASFEDGCRTCHREFR